MWTMCVGLELLGRRAGKLNKKATKRKLTFAPCLSDPWSSFYKRNLNHVLCVYQLATLARHLVSCLWSLQCTECCNTRKELLVGST